MTKSVSPIRLVAATTNRDKVKELARVIEGAAEIVLPPSDIAAPDEGEALQAPSARTAFAQNAAIKAVAWSKALSGAWTIASDGGLLVPGLGSKWNPLRTRRFAGPDATDRDRAERLLEMARGLRGSDRRIGWVEGVAIAREGRVVATFTAENPPGLLTESLPACGLEDAHGFWIPYVWRYPEFGNKLLADLTDVERAARSDQWDRLAALVRPYLQGALMGR